MAFAPHTNTDVQHRHLCGGEPLPMLLGQFYHSETHAFFEYAERLPGMFPDDFAPDFQQVLYLIDGNIRLARVLQTVAHVAVDEGPDNTAVVERWPLKRHRRYPTDWVLPAPRTVA